MAMHVGRELRTRIKLDDDIWLTFKWQGGAYIDVAKEGRIPMEVINVWDSAAGKARIPFTQEALRRCCQDWIGAYCDGTGREALIHDVKENWYR